MVFIGYSFEHTEFTYRFLNWETKKIFLSRDVVWLKIQVGDYLKLKNNGVGFEEIMKLKNLEVHEIKKENNDEFGAGIGLRDNLYGGSGELGVQTAIVGVEPDNLTQRINNFTTESEIDHDQPDDHDDIPERNNDEMK